jgi:hypothetical protein
LFDSKAFAKQRSSISPFSDIPHQIPFKPPAGSLVTTSDHVQVLVLVTNIYRKVDTTTQSRLNSLQHPPLDGNHTSTDLTPSNADKAKHISKSLPVSDHLPVTKCTSSESSRFVKKSNGKPEHSDCQADNCRKRDWRVGSEKLGGDVKTRMANSVIVISWVGIGSYKRLVATMIMMD